MKLGLYTRVSRDPDGTSDSPQRQEEACRSWAERNGHEIVRLYEDRDISGYKEVARPAFTELIDDTQSGIDGILCWRIDRLLRNWRDWATLDSLLDKGIVLFTEDGTDSRRDAAILAIKVAFAKEESRRISERVSAKHLSAAREGQPFMGGYRAFGYTRDWEIVESEAREVRWAVRFILNGGPIRGVVEEWNRRGIQTTTGRQWNPSVIRMMLKSAHIAGLRDHRGSIYPGTWEPLISEGDFEALSHIFNSRRRAAPLRFHWASGLFACGICGERLGANRGKYKCPCGKVTILIDYAERFARGALEARAKVAKSIGASKPDLSAPIAAAQFAIKDIDDARFIHQDIDQLTHRRVRKEWERKLADLLNEQQKASSPFLPEVGFDQWWGSQSLTQKSTVARAYINGILVNPPGRGKRLYDARVFVLDWR